MKFVMMCGLPGSGKSYEAKKYLDDNFLLLSSDEIRDELSITTQDKESHTAVFEEMNKRLVKAAKDNVDVVYDATNLSSKRRMNVLRMISKYCEYKKIVVKITDIDICLSNNKARDRIVPDDVIYEMLKHFTFPHYYEEWDEISTQVYSHNNNTLLEDYKAGKFSIDQDNPHHTLKLDQHMIKCCDNLMSMTDNKLLINAALYHDIGKLYTKVFQDYKGNPTDTAHYYNHENVSAYLSALYLDKMKYTNDERLEILFYIQNHMLKIDNMSEKVKLKYKNLFGEELFDNLALFNKADSLARS